MSLAGFVYITDSPTQDFSSAVARKPVAETTAATMTIWTNRIVFIGFTLHCGNRICVAFARQRQRLLRVGPENPSPPPPLPGVPGRGEPSRKDSQHATVSLLTYTVGIGWECLKRPPTLFRGFVSERNLSCFRLYSRFPRTATAKIAGCQCSIDRHRIPVRQVIPPFQGGHDDVTSFSQVRRGRRPWAGLFNSFGVRTTFSQGAPRTATLGWVVELLRSKAGERISGFGSADFAIRRLWRCLPPAPAVCSVQAGLANGRTRRLQRRTAASSAALVCMPLQKLTGYRICPASQRVARCRTQNHPASQGPCSACRS